MVADHLLKDVGRDCRRLKCGIHSLYLYRALEERDHMHAALEVNIPNYATAIVTTDEIVAAISSLKALGSRAQVLHQGAGHV